MTTTPVRYLPRLATALTLIALALWIVCRTLGPTTTAHDATVMFAIGWCITCWIHETRGNSTRQHPRTPDSPPYITRTINGQPMTMTMHGLEPHDQRIEPALVECGDTVTEADRVTDTYMGERYPCTRHVGHDGLHEHRPANADPADPPPVRWYRTSSGKAIG